MNNKDSIIEYYRKNVIEKICKEKYKTIKLDPLGNPVTYKDVNGNVHKLKKDELIVPAWIQQMKKHMRPIKKSSPKEIAEDTFNLGEHLRDIFYCTKDDTSETERDQGTLSNGGTYWEELVTYYLNMCLVNTRTVVFMQASPFKAVQTAVTFNGMNSHSEVDVIAVTFPDSRLFTDDYRDVIKLLQKKYPISNVNGTGLEFLYSNRIKKESTLLQRLADYLVNDNFKELGVHVLQCKTNWNDSVQIPMLWSLIYYLSRDGVTLPTGSNIRFGAGKYTLERLKDFSYSFVSVPTQNNGEYEKDLVRKNKLKDKFEKSFSETNLPVMRAHLIRGGYYWGLPKHNSINPISELLNTNLNNGHKGHILDIIENNLSSGRFSTEYSYFELFK